MQTPTPEQVRDILEAADAGSSLHRGLCVRGAETGEAAALRFEDVDFLRRRFAPVRSSGPAVVCRDPAPQVRSERTVPLPDELLTMLSPHVASGTVSRGCSPMQRTCPRTRTRSAIDGGRR